MPTCGNCRQEVTFYEHGGLYYCNECDTQSQVMRVIEKDDDFEASLNYTHSYSTTKKRTTTEPKNDKDVVPKKFWWSCELYQAILKAQIKALQAMGFPTKLDENVMQLWFRFLSKSGVAFGTSRKEHRDKDLFDDDIDERRGGNKVKFQCKDDWLHRREKGDAVQQSQSKKYCIRLCLWDSVCFIYAGLRLMDEPVLLSDLLRWVRQGHLPLRSSADVLPEHIAKSLSGLDFSRFCGASMSIPDVNTVFQLFHQLLVKLDMGLTLHLMIPADINFTIIRMIFSLNLPVELCGHTQRLYLKIQPALEKNPVGIKHTAPECHALAFLIVVLKLLFSLNDHLEHVMSAQTRRLQFLFPKGVHLFNWDVWVEAQKVRAQHSLSQEGSAQTFSDVMKVHNMQSYVQYFKQFFQLEQVYKYMWMDKSGCQERLKEYQRPFRSLQRESGLVQSTRPQSLAMAFPLMQPTHSDGSHSTFKEGNTDKHISTFSIDWHSKDYLLKEDFSKHTLKHLTNLKELFEEYVIPPDSLMSVHNLSESAPVDEQLPERKDSVEKVENANTAFSRTDDHPKSIKRKKNSVKRKCSHKKSKKGAHSEQYSRDYGFIEEIHSFSRGLRFMDSDDVPYLTYPTISNCKRFRKMNLKNQMDSFHASMEWLLDWCADMSEMNSKLNLAILVIRIEEILFKK